MLRDRLYVAALAGLIVDVSACSGAEFSVSFTDGDEVREVPGSPEDLGKADELDRPSVHVALPPGVTLDKNFQVFFAPNEPMLSVELRLLQEVIDARKADDRTYSAADNPYRIRYAVYNLRARDVVDKLVEARKAGVYVQALVEAEQLSPKFYWNKAYNYLKRQGFIVYDNQKGLTEAQRLEANVVGVEIDGYMHLKTRLFDIPGKATLLTGSANPGENMAYSDDSLHLVRDPQLVKAFANCYDAILAGRTVENVWRDDAPVNALFSGNARGVSAGTQILRWIDQENEQILLSVFSLRDFTAKGMKESLVTLLGEKVAQGVPVYVITDRKQSDGVDENMKPVQNVKDDPTDDRLRAVGVKVYETLNTASPYTSMHHKAAVLGRTSIRVISGSANWSFSGLGSSNAPARNLESVLFLDTSALDEGFTGRRYLATWFRILNTYAHQSVTLDREAPFDVVFESFRAMSAWPSEKLSFVVNNAQVEPLTVFIRGSLEPLGAWGEAHLGLPLITDAEVYPRWFTAEPVDAPLGAAFSWRAVASKEDGSGVKWAGNANQESVVGPGPFDDGGSAVFEMNWR